MREGRIPSGIRPSLRCIKHRPIRAWPPRIVAPGAASMEPHLRVPGLAGRGNVIQEVLEVDFFPNRASRGLGFFSLCEPQIVSIPHELEW